MRKIIFKTNYNVLIWHFVDMLSKWNYFVEPFIHKYYKKEWGLSQKDRKQLQAYSQKRSKFGWDAESDLFEWAFQGFPTNKKFSPLLEHIQYFERQRNKQNKTLQSILKKQLDNVLEGKEYIESQMKQADVNQIIGKISNLLGFKMTGYNPISAYLACSMIKGSSQGGANGDGIYAEIPPGEYDRAYEIIIHEYLHKALRPHKYFKEIQNENLRHLYNSKVNKIYQDELYHFLEEVIIHSLSDVIIHGINPEEKIDQTIKYTELKKLRRNRWIRLWTATKIVAPILKKYLANSLDKDETLAKINQKLKTYLENTSQ